MFMSSAMWAWCRVKSVLPVTVRTFFVAVYEHLALLPVVEAAGKLQDPTLPATEQDALASAASLKFPPHFRMGAATAAYQIEGGISNTNWNRWEELGHRPEGDRGPTVENGERAGTACDSWNRFDRDLALMRELKLETYRFSVEWSRIEPEDGRFDEAALDRYATWCDRLRAANIEPFITLHHFTEPGWFCDKGGWEVRDNAECFGTFARKVAMRLAPHCSLYATINEPVGYAAAGWLGGVHPPGKIDVIAFLKVA